jgi:hypothetical protein
MTKQTMTDTEILDFIEDNVSKIAQRLDMLFEVSYLDATGHWQEVTGTDLRDCIIKINDLQ